jgi:hypothetical protein
MMTLLRGLYSIATQRGEGLRPELLEMVSPPPQSSIAKMGDASPDKIASPELDKCARSAEIVALPVQKR